VVVKATEIGKLVNNLRKWKGDIGTKSKELVKKWKTLLVESEPTSRQNVSQVNLSLESEAALATIAVEDSADKSTQQQHRKHSKKHRHHRQDRHQSQLAGSVGVSERQQVAVVDGEEVRGPSSGSQRTMKRNHYEEADEFSRALTVPMPCKKARTSAGRPGGGGGSQEGGRGGGALDVGGVSGGRSREISSNLRLEVSRDGYLSRPAARPTTTTITTDVRLAQVERSPIAPPHKEPTATVSGMFSVVLLLG